MSDYVTFAAGKQISQHKIQVFVVNTDTAGQKNAELRLKYVGDSI